MKKSIIAKIGAAAVVLTMVTTSLVGGTFAKYTSTVSGTGTATVAKWAVTFKGGTDLFEENTTIKLVNTNQNAGTINDTIAPGSTGEINLNIDGTGTEVAYKYTIVLDKTSLGGIPLTFYTKKGETKTELEFDVDGKSKPIGGNVVAGTDNKNITESITWEWKDVEGNSGTDTTLGTAEDKLRVGTIGISMSAEQITDKEVSEQPTT